MHLQRDPSTRRLIAVEFDNGRVHIALSIFGENAALRARLTSSLVRGICPVPGLVGGERWLSFPNRAAAQAFTAQARQPLHQCPGCGLYSFTPGPCCDACRPVCCSCSCPMHGPGIDFPHWDGQVCPTCVELYFTQCSTPECRGIVALESEDTECPVCLARAAEADARRRAERNRLNNNPLTRVHDYSTRLHVNPCHVGMDNTVTLTSATDPRVPVGMELEVEARDRDTASVTSLFPAHDLLPSNGLYDKLFIGTRDGSLGAGGVELKFQPMTPQSFTSPWFEGLVRSLDQVATSWSNGRCGIHLSVDRRHLTDAQWTRLVDFVIANEDIIANLAGRGMRRDTGGSYCNLSHNESEPRSNDHYAAVSFSRGRVEFRMFKGTLHLGRIKAEVEFVSSIVSCFKDVDPAAALPTWAGLLDHARSRGCNNFPDRIADHPLPAAAAAAAIDAALVA